jgi:hypothetical protein
MCMCVCVCVCVCACARAPAHVYAHQLILRLVYGENVRMGSFVDNGYIWKILASKFSIFVLYCLCIFSGFGLMWDLVVF